MIIEFFFWQTLCPKHLKIWDQQSTKYNLVQKMKNNNILPWKLEDKIPCQLNTSFWGPQRTEQITTQKIVFLNLPFTPLGCVLISAISTNSNHGSAHAYLIITLVILEEFKHLAHKHSYFFLNVEKLHSCGWMHFQSQIWPFGLIQMSVPLWSYFPLLCRSFSPCRTTATTKTKGFIIIKK